jgi:hypothetical protein
MSDPLEEAKAKLRALGFDPDNPSWMKSKKVDLADLPMLKQQREMFAKVAELLQAQVEQDQNQVQALHEQIARLKRGGGR